jgi:chromosome segregation ATPase
MSTQISKQCPASQPIEGTFQPAQSVMANKYVANLTERALLERIEQLDCQLQDKNRELHSLFQEQKAINRRLIDINDTLERALSKLASTNNDFNHKSQTLLGLIADLKQENESLISANHAWSHYAIKQGFQSISAQQRKYTPIPILQTLWHWVFKNKPIKDRL